jgi:hypothetical protein
MKMYDEGKLVRELDLDPIKIKLMHKESGEGWTLDHANAVEAEYRRFLYLVKIFPHEAAAPLTDVDTFWHYHILDTMKYARDCETVFGYFLHHDPNVGLHEEDEPAIREQMGERTRKLYEGTFGEQYSLQQRRDEVAAAFSSAGIVGYCAAPGEATSNQSRTGFLSARGTAYCAAPGRPAGAATASPALQPLETGYCAAPGISAKSRITYCAAPGLPVKTALAYCAAPGLPAKSALAYCAAPGQPISAEMPLSSSQPQDYARALA